MHTEHDAKINGGGDSAVDEMTQEFLSILEEMGLEEKRELLEYIKSII